MKSPKLLISASLVATDTEYRTIIKSSSTASANKC